MVIYKSKYSTRQETATRVYPIGRWGVQSIIINSMEFQHES